MYDPSVASSCTSIAESGNASDCEEAASKLPAEIATYCE
jgi:hypothetical protein